jgi:protein-S-isoprenylcysteine O-methyltransferase Ste14
MPAEGWVPPPLGPRGEGWVAIQLLLFALAAALGLLGPPWPPPARVPLLVCAGAAALGGSLLFAAGVAALGRSLTPLPRPTERAELREAGPYRLVRHPIYGGVILLGVAWSLATSPLALAAAAGVAFFFELKSRREEAWLLERFPGYEAYRRRVRWRLIPGIR